MAKLHEKAANQRMNFLHHKLKELASNFDAVVIEDLNMKGMSQALCFGKSVHDFPWLVKATISREASTSSDPDLHRWPLL